MSDININGIPNLGFAGGGGGIIGGIPNQQPAMSADQINQSMWGRFSPQQAQIPLQNNFNNFGHQTNAYSALGAAYGRATGGFNAGRVPTGAVNRGPDLPDLSQDLFGPAQNAGPMAQALLNQQGAGGSDGIDPGMASHPSTDGMDPGMPGGFNDIWAGRGMPGGQQPSFYDSVGMGQPTTFGDRFGAAPPIDPMLQSSGAQLPPEIFGGNYRTRSFGATGAQPPTNYDPLDPSSTPTPSQFVNDGTPWWTQGTNPPLQAAHDMIRAGRGWTIGQQVGQDPTLTQNLNQNIWDVGQASTPGMFDSWGGYQQPRADHFSEQTQYPGGTGPGSGGVGQGSGSLGYQNMLGNYAPRNERGGSAEFANRWFGLGDAGRNAGHPSQYYTGNQYNAGPMPPNVMQPFNADTPDGALPLGGFRYPLGRGG
jgi:hypothetical protein